ncbi:hypothetical protein L6164_019661 [Bauhinia variegata]|uniref:Uncharacterized protein n=1 Tax=Bauhinia variegata TaxID=167791 RepID=A0ACB9MTU3_BAUVA|nr:hypothetical protein L6164_019661 [Bauhinia variegata]
MAQQVLNSCFSLLLPAGLAWFSSYVYEFFVHDTSSVYGYSATKEKKCEEKRIIFEEEEENEDEVRFEPRRTCRTHESKAAFKQEMFVNLEFQSEEMILQP